MMPVLMLAAPGVVARLLPLVIPVLLLLAQARPQRLFELLVPLAQVSGLAGKGVVATPSQGAVAAVEGLAHRLHRGPKAVASGSRLGNVGGIALPVGLELGSI